MFAGIQSHRKPCLGKGRGPTCSARKRTPFGRSTSKVSPRMGLKGFQVRSLLPKGPRQNPAIQASLPSKQSHVRMTGLPGVLVAAKGAKVEASNPR